MKKVLLAMFLILGAQDAIAAITGCKTSVVYSDYSSGGCQDGRNFYEKTVTYSPNNTESCTICNSGYIRHKTSSVTETVDWCDNAGYEEYGCSCYYSSRDSYTIDIYGCVLSCTACDSASSWSGTGAIQSRQTGGTCTGNTASSNGTCSGRNSEYRCNTGYYGSSTNGTTGCTACSSLPSPTGIPTATATNGSAGQTSATSCYIPAGSSSDSTGSFSWTPACPYVS